jgi:hypothetical protein
VSCWLVQLPLYGTHVSARLRAGLVRRRHLDARGVLMSNQPYTAVRDTVASLAETRGPLSRNPTASTTQNHSIYYLMRMLRISEPPLICYTTFTAKIQLLSNCACAKANFAFLCYKTEATCMSATQRMQQEVTAMIIFVSRFDNKCLFQSVKSD